ncbi:MAG: NUDIX domain-containing protein [Chloroflexi bacterium]|nr:NUDIX domain-containing protein [Chloroflexota bacterium]
MSNEPRVGVALILVQDKRVLLVQRKGVHGEGTWSTPGGHLEFGESPEECAAREAFEEVGVTARDVKFRAMTNDVFETTGKHYITLWMECRQFSDEPRINAPAEIADLGWFAWDALPQPLFLPLQNLLAGKCYPK